MTGARTRFEFVEGATSDLSFVAWGETLPAVFGAAADALLAATVESPQPLGEQEVRRVELEEPDRELLLLRFLNELIYLRDAEALLLRPRQIEVEETRETVRLRAELAGERLDPGRHALASEVKAATAHGLSLARDDGGFRASVTLDV